MAAKLHSLLHYLHHLLTASRGGHGVHSPLAYRLCEEVFYNDAHSYPFENLEAIRKQLLADQRRLKITDLGAGSRVLNNRERKVSDIAASGISRQRQSEILFHLVRYLNLSKIIELGTSLGLTTMYLASANSGAQVHTIEGSQSLSQFAAQLSKDAGINNITFHSGNFDTELEPLLKQLGSFDLLYMDGNHRYEPTLAYFKTAARFAHEKSVIVLDDIYWSAGMTKAWQEIKSQPGVSLSIDLYHMGLVFLNPDIKEPVALRMQL